MLYSHSRLSTFEQCPYKYKLKYIDKIQPETPYTIETFLGTRVHEVLEKLYRDLGHQKINTIEELLQYYHSQWMNHWSDDIILVKKQYAKDTFLKRGEQYIRDFYHHYFPFDQDRTVSLEDRIIIDLDEKGTYKLQGYIDRLSKRDDGNYEIHDYKTNNRIPTPDHFRKDRQLALYALGVKKQYPQVKDISLIWHFLKFDKEITSERTDKELEKLKQDVIRLIKKIEQTTSFPTTPSVLCNWCEYKPMCPQWSNLFVLNEKAENDYLSNSGVKLVDHYVALKQTTKQVKLDVFAEMEQVEKDLISFAERKGITSIVGSKYEAKIKKWKESVSYTHLTLPTN